MVCLLVIFVLFYKTLVENWIGNPCIHERMLWYSILGPFRQSICTLSKRYIHFAKLYLDLLCGQNYLNLVLCSKMVECQVYLCFFCFLSKQTFSLRICHTTKHFSEFWFWQKQIWTFLYAEFSNPDYIKIKFPA